MSPRPRKRVRVRQRDYAAEYARRQARARERGFGSYYQRRVEGVPVGERSEVRGHRGQRDLERFLRRSGENAIVGFDPDSSPRDKDGRFTAVRIQVLTADGREQEYTVRNVTEANLRRLVDLIEESGALESIRYPLSKLLEPGVSEVAA